MSDLTREQIEDLFNFLNEPAHQWGVEPMDVRDFRYKAFRKFEPIAIALTALRALQAPAIPESRDAFNNWIRSEESARQWGFSQQSIGEMHSAWIARGRLAAAPTPAPEKDTKP